MCASVGLVELLDKLFNEAKAEAIDELTDSEEYYSLVSKGLQEELNKLSVFFSYYPQDSDEEELKLFVGESEGGEASVRIDFEKILVADIKTLQEDGDTEMLTHIRDRLQLILEIVNG